MATLADIAREVGVSNKTVSLTLRGKRCSSEETAKRIYEVAERTGYLQKYATRTSNLEQFAFIGFIADHVATSPYSVELLRGAQAEALEHGRILLVGSLETDTQNLVGICRMFRAYKAAGYIYASRYRQYINHSDALGQESVVYMNCTPVNARGKIILPDDEEGGFLQASHLLELGHRKIAVISLPHEDPATSLRLKGISKAMAKQGLSLSSDMCHLGVSGYFDVGETYIAYDKAKEVLSAPERPSAIICGNDRVAMMVMNAALDLGLRIPDDLSIIGFDDFKTISEHVRPQLTTVRLPYYEMGRRAVSEIVQGESEASFVSLIRCELIRRNSCAPHPF
ncbi:LacI family DNA-binding transcriptional regulator [Cohaesibacter haloalkalitolerans]|uniref:LacI family DNA-binding transcriptional regulator n=1 Tax=Cohaesibacter haloalkalitolerans TaxID=1162980 RepID=UPI000E65AB5E|nr:LacI family DNA-binding transcriptional regulator [Cohaesibacter haloalkalitolerans]